jgi:hypothetical protein
MNVQLQERDRVNQRMLAIAEIKDKVKLLNKCQRKMQLAALDPDSVRILMAAYEQLSTEINRLCRRVGL